MKKSTDNEVKNAGRGWFSNNYMMLIAIIFLCAFGLIMIYSITSVECGSSESYGYDSFYMMKRQLGFMVMGFIAFLILKRINYHYLRPLTLLIYVAGIIATLLLLTKLGHSSKGGTRWLNIGIQFQVAELVKISVIVMLAYVADRCYGNLNKIKLTIFMWAIGGVPAILLLFISNDLSSAVVILGITFFTTFVCTKTIKLHLGVLAAAIGFVVVYMIYLKNHLPTPEELENMSFRVARLAAWIDPERYADKAGYQTIQASYAIGSGGLTGKGLGHSIQKLKALPEAQNDMIFSIICEELGIFGAAGFLFLLGYLLYQIVRVTMSSGCIYGAALSMGVFLHIAIQSVFNISVNMGLLPNTGLPLPFISYGGTSVLCLMLEMALVFSIERFRDDKTQPGILGKILNRKHKSGQINKNQKVHV